MNLWSNDKLSDRFLILKILYQEEGPLDITQFCEKISSQSDVRVFKVSGVLKETLENRLRKLEYVNGEDIANINLPKNQLK